MRNGTGYTRQFARNLFLERTRINLSQQELSERMGVDRAYISLLERGLRQPTLTIFIQAANGLGIPPEKLLHRILKSGQRRRAQAIQRQRSR